MVRTFRALRLIGAALSAGGVLAVALLASAGAAHAGPSCDVANTRSHVHYGSLQDAVTAASAGDRLRVAGICIGTTVIDRKLVIRGVQGAAGGAVLDGDRGGRVLQIASGVTVRLSGLVVRHGKVRGNVGGGILNRGKLTLTDVTVLSNSADSGGGIYSSGDLRLDGATTVKRNRSTVDDGGGIYVDGARLVMTDASTVQQNFAMRGGGGIYGVTAEMIVDATTSVHHNEATTGGGGIYADFDATLSLAGSSTVHDNVAGDRGGGVFDNASVAMSGASAIVDNTAGKRGGGVFIGCFSELTGADAGGNVRKNRPSNLAREGGCS
ncbi:hypothetical protein K2Z84_16400 [Candidatus Binatia bacterium]|nr:hypothetical protein [Candidatus Binatia bacterium]